MKVAEIKISYSSKNKGKVKIKSSDTAYKIALANWDLNLIEYQEEVKVLLLNQSNMVLGVHELSKGGTTMSLIDIKMVLAVALKSTAQGIIVIHNHPSGDLTPSQADKMITARLKKGCTAIDLNLLDHLIITKEGYYSFKDVHEL